MCNFKKSEQKINIILWSGSAKYDKIIHGITHLEEFFPSIHTKFRRDFP